MLAGLFRAEPDFISLQDYFFNTAVSILPQTQTLLQRHQLEHVTGSISRLGCRSSYSPKTFRHDQTTDDRKSCFSSFSLISYLNLARFCYFGLLSSICQSIKGKVEIISIKQDKSDGNVLTTSELGLWHFILISPLHYL